MLETINACDQYKSRTKMTLICITGEYLQKYFKNFFIIFFFRFFYSCNSLIVISTLKLFQNSLTSKYINISSLFCILYFNYADNRIYEIKQHKLTNEIEHELHVMKNPFIKFTVSIFIYFF